MTGNAESVSCHNQERCPNCGRFCGVVYRTRGPTEVEVASCDYCGLNPPKCSAEDGSVYGCKEESTHKGSFKESRRDRYWCEEHAPDDADPLPYIEEEDS